LIVHSDNARPHTAKRVDDFFDNNGMQRALHPPYSPDLAHCDFFLFGYIKEKLRGQSFDTSDELLTAITGICESIQKVTLEKVFCEWQARLARCVRDNGGLVRSTKHFS
jgi:transposase